MAEDMTDDIIGYSYQRGYDQGIDDGRRIRDALHARIAELQQQVCSLIRRDPDDDKDARIAELEAALRPFTDVESIVPFFDDAGWGLYAHVVTKRDMEAARAALEKKE